MDAVSVRVTRTTNRQLRLAIGRIAISVTRANLPGMIDWLAYVREFNRWREADPVQRKLIAMEQAGVLRFEQVYLQAAEVCFEHIMPNGKPLGECTKEDMVEIALWFHAMIEAEDAMNRPN